MADTSLIPTTRMFCCIRMRVDTACRIYAIISAVKWGLLTLLLIAIFCTEPSVGAMVLLIFLSIPFIFTLILCKGVYKRRPRLVKIYMVFAIALVVVIASIIILYALLTLNIVGGILSLVFLALYSRSLLVVKATYELFLAEETYNVAQLLAESSTKDYNSLEAIEASAPVEP